MASAVATGSNDWTLLSCIFPSFSAERQSQQRQPVSTFGQISKKCGRHRRLLH